MANTGDGLTPPDPRFGVPSALVTEAYQRCVRIAGAVFDLILRDPQLARWRLAGTYVLMHALQDSFSAAHVEPRSAPPDRAPAVVEADRLAPLRRGTDTCNSRPPTHHAITDPRDADYLRWDARSRDGRACEDFHNPYAVPEECLTERAKGGRRHGRRLPGRDLQGCAPARPRRDGRRRCSRRRGTRPPCGWRSRRTIWRAWPRRRCFRTRPRSPLRRSDVFVGAQAIGGDHTLGGGLWGAKLFLGPDDAVRARADGRGGLQPRRRRRSDRRGHEPRAAAAAGPPLHDRRRARRRAPRLRHALRIVPAGRGRRPGRLADPARRRDLAGRRRAQLVMDGTRDRPVLGGPVVRLVARADRPARSARARRPRDLGSAARGGRARVPLGAIDPHRLPGGHRDLATRKHLRRLRARVALGPRRLEPARRVRARGAAGDRRRPDRRALAGRRRRHRADAARVPAAEPPGRDRDAGAGARGGDRGPRRSPSTSRPAPASRSRSGRLDLVVDSPPLSYVSTARWHALPFTVRLGMRLD